MFGFSLWEVVVYFVSIPLLLGSAYVTQNYFLKICNLLTALGLFLLVSSSSVQKHFVVLVDGMQSLVMSADVDLSSISGTDVLLVILIVLVVALIGMLGSFLYKASSR